MFSKIVDYLKNSNTTYSINESSNSATFLARMSNSAFHCVLELRESIQILICYSYISVTIPQEKRSIISELITRINYNLLIGNFEMDLDDGEVRFKTSIDFESVELTDMLIANLIGANVSISDDYFYAIIEGIRSNLSPEEILDNITVSNGSDDGKDDDGDPEN